HKGKANFVKVVDFGIAKLTGDAAPESAGATRTGMVMGTPAYMSPEQAAGKVKEIDPRSDVYSQGVMMFQLATGRLPFEGDSFGEVLIAHLQQKPPRPRDFADVPAPFEKIILKCLAKEKDDRYESMAALRDAIAACM